MRKRMIHTYAIEFPKLISKLGEATGGTVQGVYAEAKRRMLEQLQTCTRRWPRGTSRWWTRELE